MPDCGQGDVYVRFRLGDQRVRSKVRSSFASLAFSFSRAHYIIAVCLISFFVSKPLSSQYLIKPFPPPLPPPILSQQFTYLALDIPVRFTHLPPPSFGSLLPGFTALVTEEASHQIGRVWQGVSPDASVTASCSAHLHTQNTLLIYLPPSMVPTSQSCILMSSFFLEPPGSVWACLLVEQNQF